MWGWTRSHVSAAVSWRWGPSLFWQGRWPCRFSILQPPYRILGFSFYASRFLMSCPSPHSPSWNRIVGGGGEHGILVGVAPASIATVIPTPIGQVSRGIVSSPVASMDVASVCLENLRGWQSDNNGSFDVFLLKLTLRIFRHFGLNCDVFDFQVAVSIAKPPSSEASLPSLVRLSSSLYWLVIPVPS